MVIFFCFRFPVCCLADQGSLSVIQHVVSVESSSLLFHGIETFWVWVDALRSRSTAEVMSGPSVILSTLFLGKAGNQYLAHILSPLTDNCSS